MYPKLINLF